MIAHHDLSKVAKKFGLMLTKTCLHEEFIIIWLL
jgi:hypothetical protein